MFVFAVTLAPDQFPEARVIGAKLKEAKSNKTKEEKKSFFEELNRKAAKILENSPLNYVNILQMN